MRLALLFALAATPLIAAAQTIELPAHKVTTPPVIDGTINEQEWQGAPSLEGGFDEQTGAPDPLKTVYYFAYDDKFVYFAARAYDPNPAGIKAQEYRTNVSFKGDDYVGILVDPFGQMDGQANQFEINPRGATNPRIAGGRAAKREWLGEILAKGRITDFGYEVEARIPWAVMRMPSAGKRNMRIGAYRVEPKVGRAYLVTDITGNHAERIPIWKDVDSPANQADRSLKLLPYTYLGYDKKVGTVFNSGLDFKTQTASGLDVVGSINPDFRNIENQVLSLDFSYFDRLADESRPFFLEGNQLFQTSQDAPLFASQRISRFDTGLKAFGKLGDKTTVAALDTATFDRENDFVGIVRHSFDINTDMVAAVASQTGNDDPTLRNNRNLGTYLSLNKNFGALGYFGQFMSTSDTASGDGHRINSGLTFNKNGWSGYGEYVEVSPDFELRLGFAPERGYKGAGGGFDYTKQFNKGMVLDNTVSIYGHSYDNFSGGGMYRRQINFSDSIGFRNNLGIGIGALVRDFRGFHDRLYTLAIGNPRNDLYRSWGLRVSQGNIAGHDYQSIAPSFNYRPKNNFQISASYQKVRHFDNSDQLILSGSYDINSFDSIATRLVQRGNDINGYLAYRRTGNTGNEYYLILGDPNADRFRFSIIAKAVFPLNLKF
ncbi:hypothetical protein BH11ARM1_BH11ARM1_00710 [soil metagenome]